MSLALIAALAQLAVMFLFPPIMWVFLTRALKVRWKFVGVGALTWLTALPFIFGVPLVTGLLTNYSPIAWAIALSLTAGIVEETLRYLYYRRWLRDPQNWQAAVVAGAGHGGIESIVLGLQAAFGVVAFFFMRDFLPPAMQAIEPEASYFIISAVSRLLIIVGHIGLTLLVWRAVSRQKPVYYFAAVIIHIVVNLIAFLQPTLLPGWDWLSWMAIVGLFGGAISLITISRAEAQVVARPAGL